MGHIERKKREKENTKNSILKAALDIANKEGWQAVTIRRISESIEYTTSIVYEHFENKEALLNEISINGFRSLYQQGERILSEELDPEEQLLRVSLNSWDFALKNRELYNLMFSLNQPSDENSIKGMDLIKGIFVKLTGKNESEIDSIVLNWLCLRQGSINFLMNFNPVSLDKMNDNELEIKLRELFIEFIERFISSIKPNNNIDS
jgi:AcrR family transcriptional regulator